MRLRYHRARRERGRARAATTRERDGRDPKLGAIASERPFARASSLTTRIRGLFVAGVPDLRRHRLRRGSVRILLHPTARHEPGLHRGQDEAHGRAERRRRVGQGGEELARAPRPTHAQVLVRRATSNFHGSERVHGRRAALSAASGDGRERDATRSARLSASVDALFSACTLRIRYHNNKFRSTRAARRLQAPHDSFARPRSYPARGRLDSRTRRAPGAVASCASLARSSALRRRE